MIAQSILLREPRIDPVEQQATGQAAEAPQPAVVARLERGHAAGREEEPAQPEEDGQRRQRDG